MTFDEIVKVMYISYLEKNPPVVQRINSLRISKDKDESISEYMRRIYDAYLSADLDNPGDSGVVAPPHPSPL